MREFLYYQKKKSRDTKKIFGDLTKIIVPRYGTIIRCGLCNSGMFTIVKWCSHVQSLITTEGKNFIYSFLQLANVALLREEELTTADFKNDDRCVTERRKRRIQSHVLQLYKSEEQKKYALELL